MPLPARILIVEDEQLEALSLRQVLRSLGYTVTAVVASGEEAIAQVTQAPPDLVLMDIRLAGALDGIETGAYLHVHASVPLIYLTAASQESLLDRIKLTEPDGYVLKPYQIPELQAAIELALYKHGLAAGLRAANQQLEQEMAARREKEQLVQQLNEQLLAQNASLHTSEARFHRMADNIQDGLIIVEDDHLVYMNGRACTLLGYPGPRVTPIPVADFFPPGFFLPWTRPLADQTGVMSAEDEVWVMGRDGVRRCLHYRTTADYLGNGMVQHYISLTDITERKQMEEHLREASFHDALTGLYNRAFFEEEVQRLERDQRQAVSVIIADVDGLKLVNDQRGHRAGDDLLRQAATVLRRPLRAGDVVARIGGDEFGVLLPNTFAPQAVARLADIRAAVQHHNLTAADLPISLSLGTATAEFSALSLAAAIELADARMYQDKLARPR